jgi:hypothetical protein
MQLSSFVLEVKLDRQAGCLGGHSPGDLFRLAFRGVRTGPQPFANDHPFAVDLDDSIVDFDHAQRSFLSARWLALTVADVSLGRFGGATRC